MRHNTQDWLYNLWGPVQNENVRCLFENYCEFQDSSSIALKQKPGILKLGALCSGWAQC